jgi:hypothetical protein
MTVGVALRLGELNATIIGGVAHVDGILRTRGSTTVPTSSGDIVVTVRGEGVLNSVELNLPSGAIILSKQYGVHPVRLPTGYYQDISLQLLNTSTSPLTTDTSFCFADVEPTIEAVEAAARIFSPYEIADLSAVCGAPLAADASCASPTTRSDSVCAASSTGLASAEAACQGKCVCGDDVALENCAFDFCMMGGGPHPGLSCNFSNPCEHSPTPPLTPAPAPPGVCLASSCHTTSRAASGVDDNCCAACEVYGPLACRVYDPDASECC